jgi:hypothetical protein
VNAPVLPPSAENLNPQTLSGTRRGPLLLSRIVLLLAALPALYLFFAIQRGAITVPFWDHCGLINILASWYDGDFDISSLWAPDNQARPLVYRLVMGVNAVLTDWDVRSEFTYIYASFYGVFALHAWALKKVTGSAYQNTIVFPVALLLTSLIVFSPVAHNDHWWSLMFILDGANLLIALSLLTVFLRPESMTAHLAAAAICWVATYTFANGMFAMLAVVLVFQLASERLFRPNRWALFWAANLAVLMVCYLPGIAMSSAHHPSPLQLGEFFFTFLGIPFGGLIFFPYRNMFDLPVPIAFNALCGVVLVAFSALLCWHARGRLRAWHPAALILFGFTLFALISALITGWGRANFDLSTVSNGNASRYTIFSAYLMLGQLYYLAAGFSHRWWNHRALRIAASAAATVFAVFSTISYGRAWPVYANAHEFNKLLINAYSWGLQPNPLDSKIFPDPQFVTVLKSDLQRLELGPYGDRPFDTVTLPIGPFKTFLFISTRRQISEIFTADHAGLKALDVTIVKPYGPATAGIVTWQVTAAGATQPLARGSFPAPSIDNWEVVRLKLPYLGNSNGQTYRVTIAGSTDDAHGLGIPLYTPAAQGAPAVVDTETGQPPTPEGLSMGLSLDYAD